MQLSLYQFEAEKNLSWSEKDLTHAHYFSYKTKLWAENNFILSKRDKIKFLLLGKIIFPDVR